MEPWQKIVVAANEQCTNAEVQMHRWEEQVKWHEVENATTPTKFVTEILSQLTAEAAAFLPPHRRAPPQPPSTPPVT
jgi:16S rRNA U1498 N3-methylase RsmE